MTKSAFISARETYLATIADFTCPRPFDHEQYVDFLMNDHLKHIPCISCKFPRAFYHAGKNWDSNCEVEPDRYIEISNYMGC